MCGGTEDSQNMKLRAYLVDDEPLALERLRGLLSAIDSVEVVGDSTVPEEAVAALQADPPDLCILDIEMPRLNGFDVLAQLARPPVVVFTTAYDQFALKAFGVDAVDYLLKPVEPEALERAIQKALRLRRADGEVQPQMRALLERIEVSLREVRASYPQRIASRLGSRICFLDLAQVMHFQALDKLTFAVTEDKSYCVDHTIADLEAQLDPRQFLRIHRSTVVNLDWIKDVMPQPAGGLKLRLRDSKGTQITVARDRTRAFRQRLGC